MNRLQHSLVVVALVCLAAASVVAAAGRTDVDTSRSAMRPLIERYASDRAWLVRFLGDVDDYSPEARFGADFEPMSAAQIARLRAFTREWRETLAGVPFDTFDQESRVDYLLLSNRLKYESSRLDLIEKRLAAVEPLVPFGGALLALDEARRAGRPVEPEASARVLDGVLKKIEATRQAVESGVGTRAAKEDLLFATAHVGRLRAGLGKWFAFYNGYDPLFTWWVGRTFKDTDQALERYAAFLRGRAGGEKDPALDAVIVNPIGREALMVELEREMIAYTPEELIAIAGNEYAWCEREMVKAARDMGFGDDWHAAMEKVKGMHPAPGRQPEVVRHLVLDGMDFVEKHDLVTVPPLAKETWRMHMLSPEQQLVSPFFLGGDVMMVAYPTDTMTYDQKMMSMRGNNTPFSHATAYHEEIPGHELQEFMIERYRVHRASFGTPFWIEGNALWWEMMMWDLGYPGTPEERIGMLFWRMHRCVRIMFSLGYHLGTVTPAQAVDMLVTKVGHERNTALGEVRRSFGPMTPPLYQCAYLVGALQFRALHRELVDSKKMTNRAFHDAILHENGIPVDLIRADLTNLKLTRDYETSWKFYGPIPGATAQ